MPNHPGDIRADWIGGSPSPKRGNLMHTLRRFGIATCLCGLMSGLMLSSALSAGGVDPARFQALHWRGIGPYRGGRVLAVSGVPGDPYVFYFGGVAGGVWKTTDAGVSWTS